MYVVKYSIWNFRRCKLITNNLRLESLKAAVHSELSGSGIRSPCRGQGSQAAAAPPAVAISGSFPFLSWQSRVFSLLIPCLLLACWPGFVEMELESGAWSGVEWEMGTATQLSAWICVLLTAMAGRNYADRQGASAGRHADPRFSASPAEKDSGQEDGRPNKKTAKAFQLQDSDSAEARKTAQQLRSDANNARRKTKLFENNRQLQTLKRQEIQDILDVQKFSYIEKYLLLLPSFNSYCYYIYCFHYCY